LSEYSPLKEEGKMAAGRVYNEARKIYLHKVYINMGYMGIFEYIFRGF
jgi:hypothetical protein